jgi:hypothetical protein
MRADNKLTRPFAGQVSALKEYRSKGEQKMTVQHVHVAEGGQAIAGNAPAEGAAARKKWRTAPGKAIEYAPSVAMPCTIEAERDMMQSAGRAGD